MMFGTMNAFIGGIECKSRGGQQNYQRDGAPLLKVERIGIVQSGKGFEVT